MSWQENYKWERESINGLRMRLVGKDHNNLAVGAPSNALGHLFLSFDLTPQQWRKIAHDIVEASYAREQGPPKKKGE